MYDPEQLPFPERDFLYFGAYMVRSILLNESARESCMVSAHAVAELYRRFGITSIPVVVQVTALNKAAHEAAQRGEAIGLNSAASSDAFVTQIKHDPEQHSEDALQGHVALLVANRYMVDPSIDQLARPARGIIIEPLIMPFDEEVGFEDFLGGAKASVELPNGGALVYEPHPEDLAYLDFCDWEPVEDDPRLMEALAGAEGLVRFALDEGEFPPLPPLPDSVSTTMVKLQSRLKEFGASAAQAAEAIERMGWTAEEFEGTGERLLTMAQKATRRQAASGT